MNAKNIRVEVLENGYVIRASYPRADDARYPDDKEWVAYNGTDLDTVIAKLKAGEE